MNYFACGGKLPKIIASIPTDGQITVDVGSAKNALIISENNAPSKSVSMIDLTTNTVLWCAKLYGTGGEGGGVNFSIGNLRTGCVCVGKSGTNLTLRNTGTQMYYGNTYIANVNIYLDVTI